ncbi:DotD/TraH family lipoprotein [Rhizobium laguerreae]|uniref:DotD/TraH family lipoprotein n=1 Tax=Rhizobium laguerreae TaxID=1076926 RepID=UPI001C91397A|nr:DotD/TraH family lipoprotein [Rhizobium laguerreae]MBY3155274.1 DotD/TraH family lipoprotein [Rhizobium laguerreae]
MSLKAVLTASVVTATLFMAGCSTTKTPDNDISDVYSNQAIDKELADAVSRASKAQETLARVQVARTTPTPSALDESSLPEELKRPATIDWSGPAHEAAEKIANLVGYQFKITGNRPSIPPMVHVSVQDISAAKALEDIGLQAFPFGEVSVDPNAKRIEFRYLQAQQQPIRPNGTSPSWGK